MAKLSEQLRALGQQMITVATALDDAEKGTTGASGSPGLEFGAKDDGTPFTSQAEADAWHAAVAVRDANLAAQQAQMSAEHLHGPVDVASLTHAEMAFLLYAEENYSMKYTGLFYAVLNGSKRDIDAAIAWADDHRGQVPDSTRLAGYVDSFSKGMLSPVYQ